MSLLIKIVLIGVAIVIKIFIFDISFSEEVNDIDNNTNNNNTDDNNEKTKSFIEQFKDLKKNKWIFAISILLKLVIFLDLTNFTIIKTIENLAIYFDYKLNTDNESKNALNEIMAEFYYNRDPNTNVKVWTWRELFKYIISLIVLLIG